MGKRESEWIMVRIKRTTAAELRRLQAVWVSQYLKGNMTVPCPDDKLGISMDRIIWHLLNRDNKHRERGRSNSKKRKRPSGPEEQGETQTD